MKKRLISYLQQRKKTSHFLYALAGAYLSYLAYQILTNDSGTPVLPTIIAVAFALCGIWLLGSSTYALFAGYYQGSSADSDNNEDKCS